MVIAPAHHRRIQAGILSWGQDLDHETSPFQVNLSYQVPRNKEADYIGKEELERQRDVIDGGEFPFKMRMVGMIFGGKEITDYAPDFWLIADTDGNDMGYITSPWWSPELETNVALGWVPWVSSEIGTKLQVRLPDEYSESPGVAVEGEIVDIPFRESVNPNKREVQKDKGLDYAD
jgi:aminomethyltransferase